jgi:hypothetical protein
MKPRQTASHETMTADYRPPYLAAAFATVGVLALYALTLAPTTQFWDASEYIATGHRLGIPHPPGNPTFVVLARAWDVLLSWTGLSVAVRINLLSATMSALAHGLWFLLAHRVLSYYSEPRWFRIAGAAAATLLAATAFSVWNQSNVNEKVYTISLATIALISWLAFRWRDALGTAGNDRKLVLIAFLLALSVGNHLMAFLAAPATLAFIVFVRARTLRSPRLWVCVLCAALVGLSIHLFLPLRAALGPVINEADPSSQNALLESLARTQYDKPSIFVDPNDTALPRSAPFVAAQLANFVQLFDWQWARSLGGTTSWFGGARPLVTLLALALGLFGALTHWRRDRATALYVTILYATLSLGLVAYLNFRYGFSYPDPEIPATMREVRERDYFFIGAFSLWGVWMGIGLAALWSVLAARLTQFQPRRALLVTAPVLALAVVPLALNWSWATRAGDTFARDWAHDILMSVEPYGVLITNGDNDTFPLWYAQEVEGLRRDVTVIVATYLNTSWAVKQARDLTRACPAGVSADDDASRIICQRPYDAAAAPAIYRRATVNEPVDSVLRLTDAEIEQIAASVYELDRPAVIHAANIEARIPAGTVMFPADSFLAAIVVQNLGVRPIHFATPAPSAQKLGLSDHLVRVGVTFRLATAPVTESGTSSGSSPGAPDGIVEVRDQRYVAGTGRWVDLARSKALLSDTFINRTPPQRVWVDAATTNVPAQYMWAEIAVAAAESARGNTAEVDRHAAAAGRWAEVAMR